MGTAIGVHPEHVAFLLKVDGSIEKVSVPRDENGVPVRMLSMGWRMFMQDMLDLVYTVEGEELPDVPTHMWTLEDTVRLPSKTWNVTCADEFPVADRKVSMPVQWMVKAFTRPYDVYEESHEEPPAPTCPTNVVRRLSRADVFNKCSPLFSTSQYWHGNLLLVCYSESPHIMGPYGWLQEIVSPRKLLGHIPAALKDFWDVGLQTWQELQLAFAMATHDRLGTQADARILDDNLLHMIFDTALTHKHSLQVPDEVGELRGVFHAMLKEWEFDSEDEEDEEDEEHEEHEEHEEDEEHEGHEAVLFFLEEGGVHEDGLDEI